MSSVTDAGLWYTARGSGVVSLVLLTIVVALGIASRSGRRIFGMPRFAVQLVHRNASLLAVVTLVLHIVTLLLDSKAGIHVTAVLVPFVGSYRPFWQGLGTLGLELILALVITSLLRNHMPERIWRGVHWLAYVSWPVAFAHGLGTGTDSGAAWMRAIAGVCAAAVLAAVVWRLVPHFVEHSRIRRPRATSAARTALGRAR
jgi:methionine sulfoxide reductase heme-binding subunit